MNKILLVPNPILRQKSYPLKNIKSEDIDIKGHSADQTMGGARLEKDFSVTIKGEKTLRNYIMKEYKKYIKNSLKNSNLKVTGYGGSGNVISFQFNYEAHKTKGIFKADSYKD